MVYRCAVPSACMRVCMHAFVVHAIIWNRSHRLAEQWMLRCMGGLCCVQVQHQHPEVPHRGVGWASTWILCSSSCQYDCSMLKHYPSGRAVYSGRLQA